VGSFKLCVVPFGWWLIWVAILVARDHGRHAFAFMKSPLYWNIDMRRFLCRNNWSVKACVYRRCDHVASHSCSWSHSSWNVVSIYTSLVLLIFVVLVLLTCTVPNWPYVLRCQCMCNSVGLSRLRFKSSNACASCSYLMQATNGFIQLINQLCRVH
jgi:hypothetical protein